MRLFLTGIAAGLFIGIFAGLYLGHFPDAVRATAIGFGAGAGIFALGAIARYVTELADMSFGRIKEGKTG